MVRVHLETRVGPVSERGRCFVCVFFFNEGVLTPSPNVWFTHIVIAVCLSERKNALQSRDTELKHDQDKSFILKEKLSP